MVQFKVLSTVSFIAIAMLAIPSSSAYDEDKGYKGIRAAGLSDHPFNHQSNQVNPSRDLQRNRRDRPDFETLTCIEPVDDVEVCDTREGEGLGLFVCRSVPSPTTGQDVDVAVCINPNRSIDGDVCGCCGIDCPDQCQCKCRMDSDDDEETNPGDDESDRPGRGGGRGRGRGPGRGGRRKKGRGIELVVDGETQCVNRVDAYGLLTGGGDVTCSTACRDED